MNKFLNFQNVRAVLKDFINTLKKLFEKRACACRCKPYQSAMFCKTCKKETCHIDDGSIIFEDPGHRQSRHKCLCCGDSKVEYY